jgi:hypothetical protein
VKSAWDAIFIWMGVHLLQTFFARDKLNTCERHSRFSGDGIACCTSENVSWCRVIELSAWI